MKENLKKIVCFHLLNDFSGSPKVLEMVLRGLALEGVNIDLYTSRGGVLDHLKNVESIKLFSNDYCFKQSGFIQIIRFVYYQIYFFILSFKYIGKKNHVFYINTLLPVGAALGAYVTNKKIVYHYHENADVKGLIYRILCKVMCVVASDIICVSNYQAERLASTKKVVIPNSLPKEFEQIDVEISKDKSILMLSSLKKYKGILEFIELSKLCSRLNFILVLNADQEELESFLKEERIAISDNLRIYSRQEYVISFYKNASVLLNLSNPNLFIETFGLTVIEAMAFGVPAIVPKEGGIAELVVDGVNGFKVDVLNVSEIREKLFEIIKDENTYSCFSNKALATSKGYKLDDMIKKVRKVLIDEK